MSKQQERVLQYMRDFGSITAAEAMRDLGVMRLAAVVFDLKKAGVNIKTTTASAKNRYGEAVHFARYMVVQNEI